MFKFYRGAENAIISLMSSNAIELQGYVSIAIAALPKCLPEIFVRKPADIGIFSDDVSFGTISRRDGRCPGAQPYNMGHGNPFPLSFRCLARGEIGLSYPFVYVLLHFHCTLLLLWVKL